MSHFPLLYLDIRIGRAGAGVVASGIARRGGPVAGGDLTAVEDRVMEDNGRSWVKRVWGGLTRLSDGSGKLPVPAPDDQVLSLISLEFTCAAVTFQSPRMTLPNMERCYVYRMGPT
jgi:hypothetical protein